MASNDKGAGPQVGQMVLYNLTGTGNVPAVITQINATGTVGVSYFTGAGATFTSGVGFDPAAASNKWSYMPFF